jgi:hypothetical protein
MQSMPPPRSMQPKRPPQPPRAPPMPAPSVQPPQEQVAVERPHPAQNIARLMGPVLLMVGTGMLANGVTYRSMAVQFFSTLPLIYVSGILMLVSGLAILNTHPQWPRDWGSVVTAVGWILTCVGAFRIIAPQFANFVATSIVVHAGFFVGTGVVVLALGGFITFKGYVA